MLSYAWMIPLLPAIAFAINILLGRRLRERAAYISIAAIVGSCLVSLPMIWRVLQGDRLDISLPWLTLGDIELGVGLLIDPLAAVMLFVVTFVASCIHIYSIGYMHGDPRYSRFFAYLSLFSAAMLNLVVANNLAQLFVGWEGVGLTSYLLIGFWFEKKSAADAGKKAFITTKIGDLGFFAGILLLLFLVRSLHFETVFQAVHEGLIPGSWLTLIAVLIFCGAVGKSAQFPLHVWLPDAMEGPTPVSALIHAATMVAAGVYLVARCFTVFAASAQAMLTVATIGCITAVMAASIGLVQNDIKRVLAYSTISQLGYMMLALGAGGYTAGVFHLYTHAFFKALLFLGAGSVIHAMHTNDMQEMGGLYPRMKITAWTMIIASLSIAGVPPLSGFWSKDEIIATLYGSGGIFFWLALATAFMTAFYMFRLIFLTFFGKPRDQERFAHAHESPKVMTVPLMVLAVFSIIGGWVGIPWLEHGFSGFIFYGHEPHHVEVNFVVMGGSIIVALGGIFLAYAMYVREWLSPRAAGQRLAPIYRLLYHKYYFDELYSILIIRPVLALSRFLGLFDLRVVDGAVNGSAALTVWISRLQGLFDNRAVDGLVNLVGWVWMAIGRSVRRVQSGLVQNYALILFLGLAILVLLRLFASG